MRYNQDMLKLHEQIKVILARTPGLTQKGLAAHLNLNPAAVNRMLHGQRKILAEEVPLIEAYLGQTLSDHRGNDRMTGGVVSVPAMGAQLPPVPVYNQNLGRHERDPVDFAPRVPALNGIRDAFALYVDDEAMAPRYEVGELVYIHPGRPPERGRDCVIELQDGRLIVRRFVAQGRQGVELETFAPPRQEEINRAEILGVYAVVGRG